MKKRVKTTLKVKGLVLLLAIAGFAGFVGGVYFVMKKYQSVDIVDINMYPEQFIDDFTEIINIVKKNYSHWESKRINSDSLFIVYSQYLKAVKTNDEYKHFLLAYFAELKNMHTNVYITPSYYINCSAKLFENRVFIDGIGSSVAVAGVNIKDEILAVEGVSVLEWLNQQQKFVNASTDEARLNGAIRHIFFDYSGGIRTLLLNTQTGEKEVKLSFVKNPGIVTSSIINDSIGYICINSMEEKVVADFKEESTPLSHFFKTTTSADFSPNDGENRRYSQNNDTSSFHPVKYCKNRDRVCPILKFWAQRCEKILRFADFRA